ncbi:stalk domain-containing protein [Heliobacterium chlorum]|nr:stalk domain-containing protein [Heliobacterium chlorum]
MKKMKKLLTVSSFIAFFFGVILLSLLPTKAYAWQTKEEVDKFNFIGTIYEFSSKEDTATPTKKYVPKFKTRPYVLYRMGNTVFGCQPDLSFVGKDEIDWADVRILLDNYSGEDIISINGKPWKADPWAVKKFGDRYNARLNHREVFGWTRTLPMEAYPKLPESGHISVNVFGEFRVGSVWTNDTAEPLWLSVSPFWRNEVPYIPIKDVLSPLGASFTFDLALNDTTIKANGHTVIVHPGSQIIYVDEKEVNIGCNPLNIDEIMCVPAKVAEYLGFTVDTFYAVDRYSPEKGYSTKDHIERITVTK